MYHHKTPEEREEATRVSENIASGRERAKLIKEKQELLDILCGAFDRGYFDHHPDDSKEEYSEKELARDILRKHGR